MGKTTPSLYFLVKLGDGTKERTNIKQKTVRDDCFLLSRTTALTFVFMYDKIFSEESYFKLYMKSFSREGKNE